ncbi:hypothetical protein HK100_004302 [Physocladia obscura]|uniref:Uncharacterized protein n=1 Tax=Physocladia obscura TaxID=109957 RepID=A0AAD5TCC1_9FUNG|nr:hypothetical protein HK100_004302 [Physocladia obscura]
MVADLNMKTDYSVEIQLGVKHSLGPAILVDCVAGFTTALAIAPIVAIIDRSIIANASGRMSMRDCIREGLNTLANIAESVYLDQKLDPTIPKFISSATVNISLCLWKDHMLARWFGTGSQQPFPKVSYGLFMIRDSMTVISAFTLPPIASGVLQKPGGVGASKRFADTLCQVTIPCLVQAVSSPLHLLSFDLFNRPKARVMERFSFIREKYVSTTLGRMARTLPGFGIGGLVNTNVRAALHQIL